MPLLILLILGSCVGVFALTGSSVALGSGTALVTLTLLLRRRLKWAAYFALVSGLLFAHAATKELVLAIVLGAIPLYALAILIRPSLLRKPRQLS